MSYINSIEMIFGNEYFKEVIIHQGWARSLLQILTVVSILSSTHVYLTMLRYREWYFGILFTNG